MDEFLVTAMGAGICPGFVHPLFETALAEFLAAAGREVRVLYQPRAYAAYEFLRRVGGEFTCDSVIGKLCGV